MRIFNGARADLLDAGRVGRYLRYSLGEIVLVVVGILMALQVNNWNEARIERQRVRASALALKSDLAQDLRMLVPVEGQIRRLIRQADSLADYTRGKPNINRVRDLNYPQLPDARTYFDQFAEGDREDGYFQFTNTETFRAMQRESLPLLTTDPAQVRLMVNAMLDIREAITPRVEGELPRLRQLSAEITDLIEREYH